MDSQTRDSEENKLWANPCDYHGSDASTTVTYSPKLAKDVASQARNAVKSISEFKDKLAMTLHSYSSFDELIQEWSAYEWLRKFPWSGEDVLPKKKSLNQTMPDEDLNQLMPRIDEVLPSMYKGLKMVVAGLYALSNVLNDNIKADGCLKLHITKSMHDVRGVLCLFNDIMKAKNLDIMPLPDSEIPDLKAGDEISSAGLLIYRDTLIYLEYLDQVFQKMYETDLEKSG